MCAHASGSRCRNTSPSSPPTAKLNSKFSRAADSENTQIKQNFEKEYITTEFHFEHAVL